MSRSDQRSTARWGSLALVGLAIGAQALGPPQAIPHTGGSTGYASITVQGRDVRYSLTLLPAFLPKPIAEELRRAQGGDRLMRERFIGVITGKVTIRDSGMTCTPGPGRFESSAPSVEVVTIVVDYACAGSVTVLTVRDDIFDELGADHHTLAKIELPGSTQQFAFTPETREATFAVQSQSGRGHGFRSFVLLGIEHILTGYDHLLFLLALLLRGGGLASLVQIITAFTVAHSITLALAVLDVVQLPDRLVEAVIALSIAFVAAENVFLPAAVSHRWLVSFVFGLVHGFGFSGALRELGLPRQGLAFSLLGFNLGVEAGQAMAVAVLLPFLMLLRRTQWEGRVVATSSAAILIVGLIIFLERVLLA